MKHDSAGNIGAQRSHTRPTPSTPYSRPQSQGHPSARITRSMSTLMLARSDVLTPDPPTQLVLPPPPANNPQANGTVDLPPSWSLIPQKLYAPAKVQGGYTPANPVSFFVNDEPGISVSQAVAEDYTGLDGRDDGISSFARAKIMCRIHFAGRGLRSPKINVRHNNANWSPITRCKLAKEVGRRVKEYIEFNGLEGIYAFERVRITRLIQVSEGSWQPELYCEDLATPNLNV